MEITAFTGVAVISSAVTCSSTTVPMSELPASIAILSTTVTPTVSVTDTTVSIEAVIGNVGNAPAENVSITAESDLPVSPTKQTIGAIAENATEPLSIEVATLTEGQHDVILTAKSKNAGTDSETVMVTVLAKCELLDSMTELIDDLIECLTETSHYSKQTETALITKLETVQTHLRRAQTAIDHDKHKQAVTALNIAINQMEAFLNAFGKAIGYETKSSPTALTQKIEQSATTVIDQLTRVRDALTVSN